MSTIYVIDNTSGELSITIAPGTLNGSGSTSRNSDLRLYGMGALMWGEGVDENFLRLTENFAVLAKEDGDFLPGGLAGNTDYLVASHPTLPKDENDLGPGFGINVPLNGQQWFNDTAKSTYAYDGTAGTWTSISAADAGPTPPVDPILGQTWFDTNLTGPCNEAKLKVYNPTHSAAPANGFVGVAEDYVSACGDFMSGALTMSVDGGTTRHLISSVGDPVSTYDAATKKYVDDATAASGGDLTTHMGDMTVHLGVEQNSFLDQLTSSCMAGVGSGFDVAVDLCHLAGWNISTGAVYTEVQSKLSNAGDSLISGFISLTAVNPTNDLHAVNRGWVNSQIAGIPPAVSSIPSGTKMLFAQTAAPTGWIQDVTQNDRMLRVVSGLGGGLGGTDSPTFMNKVPAHTHAVTGSTTVAGAHTHSITYLPGITPTQAAQVQNSGNPDTIGGIVSTAGDHSHAISVTASINAGSSNWAPKYSNVIIATKV